MYILKLSELTGSGHFTPVSMGTIEYVSEILTDAVLTPLSSLKDRSFVVDLKYSAEI
jgi:hypothetical protein